MSRRTPQPSSWNGHESRAESALLQKCLRFAERVQFGRMRLALGAAGAGHVVKAAQTKIGDNEFAVRLVFLRFRFFVRQCRLFFSSDSRGAFAARAKSERKFQRERTRCLHSCLHYLLSQGLP